MKKHYSLMVVLLFSMIFYHANAAEREELADVKRTKKLCIDADRSTYSPELRKYLKLPPNVQHLALDDSSSNLFNLLNQIQREPIILLPLEPLETAAASSSSAVSRKVKSPPTNDPILACIYSHLNQLGRLDLFLPKLRDNLNSLVGVSRVEQFFSERLRVLSNQFLKQSRKKLISLLKNVAEEAQIYPKPVSLIGVQDLLQVRENMPLQAAPSGSWNQVIQYIYKNKKTILGSMLVAAMVGGAIVYYLQPAEQEELQQLENCPNLMNRFSIISRLNPLLRVQEGLQQLEICHNLMNRFSIISRLNPLPRVQEGLQQLEICPNLMNRFSIISRLNPLPRVQEEYRQFENYSNFTIYFPTHLSFPQNFAAHFGGRTQFTDQVESTSFGKLSEYGDYEGEIRIIDADRMVSPTKIGESRRILARCTRFCAVTISFLIEETSGIICQQISTLVFGKMFDGTLDYIVPPGHYSVTKDIGKYGDAFPSNCPYYMQYKY